MKNFLYLFIGLLLVSCYKVEKPKKPENLIAKDKMVHILLDMSILNSAKGINKKTLENKGVDLQKHVFEKYGIDSLQFANSNYYYTYQIDEYKDIYVKVRDSLNKLKQKYTAIDKKETTLKFKVDSVKRAEKQSSIKNIGTTITNKQRQVSKKPN